MLISRIAKLSQRGSAAPTMTLMEQLARCDFLEVGLLRQAVQLLMVQFIELEIIEQG